MADVMVKVSGLEALELNMQTQTKAIENNLKRLLDEMGNQGLDSAVNGLGHIDTGETLASIKLLKTAPNRREIHAGGNAVWLEFGTGVARNHAPHPEPADGTPIAPHGTYGKGKGANPNGWWYETDSLTFSQMKNGDYSLSGDSVSNVKMYAHTRGIAATMFMFKAYKMLCNTLHDTARKVFSSR